MSTDLYGIRVKNIQEERNTFEIKVFVVYYDTTYKSHQPLPKDHSFFLRILWDEGDTRFGGGGSIGHEISVDDICDENWVDRNTFRFIKKVEQISTANFPLNDYETYADFYYERDGAWLHEDQLVQATYKVEVTNSKYLDHLSPGMSWGTTSYETRALQIAHDELHRLPNLSEPVIRFHPFKDSSQADNKISDVLFSADETHFFVLSISGELVCYRLNNWEAIWRKNTQISSGIIDCDDNRKLVWVQNENDSPKPIFDFTGVIMNEHIWPNAETSLHAAHRSPSGNYFLLPPYIVNENIEIYDAQGKFLWQDDELEGEELRHAFFPKEEKLLVLALSLDMLKVFDLETGKELLAVECDTEHCGYGLSVAPTGQFFSYNAVHYAKHGLHHTTRIVDLNTRKTVFEYSSIPSDRAILKQCTWSPNHQFAAIVTTGEGRGGNRELGGEVSIYPIGN